MKKIKLGLLIGVVAVCLFLEPLLVVIQNGMLEHWYFSYYEIIDLIVYFISEMSIRLIAFIAITALLHFANSGQLFSRKEESSKQIQELRARLVEETAKEKGSKDVLELMLNNMTEIQAYYSISKKHAWFSFGLAVVFCFLGFSLFSKALSADVNNQQAAMIGLVGGAISEFFAGTALFVHKSSLKQLNRYYIALHENERFLSILNLVDRLSPEKRDEAIEKIIDNSLANITSLVSEFSSDK